MPGSKPIESRKIDMVSALREFQSIAERVNLAPELVDRTSQEILGKIGQSRIDVEKRLYGLRAEYEFLLMVLLLGNVQQVTPLVQKQWVNWRRFSIPDFLMSVKVPQTLVEGEQLLVQRMLVDVKTNAEEADSILIPKDVLNKLLGFSALYQLPLYLAISMKSKGFRNWFLVSASALVNISTKVQAAPRGREEECLLAQIPDLLKEDLSGMWLSNHTVFVPGNSEDRIFYSKLGEGPIHDEKYGRLVRFETTSSHGKIAIEFGENQPAEELLTEQVLRRLPYSSEAVTETSEGFQVIRERDVDYGVPFQALLVDTYLDMRRRFEPFISSNPSNNPTPTYFLERFADFDRNLAAGIRNVIWKLSAEKIIALIRMVPERYFSPE